MTVNTKKVANRRQLHFDRIEDILADVEQLNRGKVKTLGNWSGGQILVHLAGVMNGSIDGIHLRLAWPIRFFGRLLKRRILSKPMPAGFKLKGRAAAALVPPQTSWQDGVDVIRKAIQRQQTEAKREPSPFLGRLTREQWEQLHCRHAELHLSFVLPE
jgi:hypothetical protein